MLLKPTAHLGHWSQTPLKLELIDSHVGWLSTLCSSTNLPLPPSTTYTHTVNDVPLFRLVPQSTSFIWPRGSRSTMYGGQLPVLPASHTQKKAKKVWLLLPPKFLQILIGTHFCPRENRKRALNMMLTHLNLSCVVDCRNKIKIYLPPSPLLSFTSCTQDQWRNLIRMRKKARGGSTPVNHDVNVNKCDLTVFISYYCHLKVFTGDDITIQLSIFVLNFLPSCLLGQEIVAP